MRRQQSQAKKRIKSPSAFKMGSRLESIGPTSVTTSTCALITRLVIHQVHVLFLFLLWVTEELSTLRQMMKVPNEPGLSRSNGLENAFLSDQSMASNPREVRVLCFHVSSQEESLLSGFCSNLKLSGFCFDFGGDFLFITSNMVWGLANGLFMSAACFAGGI